MSNARQTGPRRNDYSNRKRPTSGTLESSNGSIDDEEPLSLAEELAAEVARGGDPREHQDRYDQAKQGDTHIAELQKMSMPQLIEQARKEQLTDIAGAKRQDLIFKIL
ncbi:MAG: Rho termination factor N-terminal domain-containing protein, partial [Planctomycetia bacterium]|nr:Rho termination factor N-terminal domain-containing protein [Planctomycetia bacterium]